MRRLFLTEAPKTSLFVCVTPKTSDPVPSSMGSNFPNCVDLWFSTGWAVKFFGAFFGISSESPIKIA